LSRIRNAVIDNKKLAEKIVFTASKDNDNFDSLLVVETDVQ